VDGRFPYLTDVALARRLERAEGSANAAFVESRRRITPESGAEWCEVGGTYAMFDGVDSPLTQTFGFGLFTPPSETDLDTIERFYGARGAPVFHEVSPLADAATLTIFGARGYRPIELTAVMHQPITAAMRSAPPNDDIAVRVTIPGEEALWAETAALGWGETVALADFMRLFGTVSAHARGTHGFLASIGETPVAAAALALHGGVALLAGASTIPAWRGRGVQRALLAARLRYAAERGAEVAMMCALPGSASQRNAERAGFRIAYTRIKWQLVRP
jgi:GNAT superfamily N-acetyltransferase